MLMGARDLKEYLTYRYGDFIKFPSIKQQKSVVYAEIFNTEKGYKNYI